ncbi:MAG: outer membrane protein assembly factor BamA [Candidatus Schekmanbacteria bacterium]|nr:outer membrane protein assembly factor BamA [Candidatus Schekmanbacteria bacterium]
MNQQRLRILPPSGPWLVAAAVLLTLATPLCAPAAPVAAGQQEIGPLEFVPSETGKTILKVSVDGNVLINADTVLFRVSLKPGDPFDSVKARNDIKALYATGFFNDVQVDVKETAAGLLLTYVVDEKPRIRQVVLSGYEALKEDKIREVLTVKEDGIYSPAAVKESVVKIKEAYLEQGYYFVDIIPVVQPVGKKLVELDFQIDEGQKLLVGSVAFTGNKSYRTGRLRRVLKETRRHWFLSWLTGKGKFNPDLFEQDLKRVEEFYQDRGFAAAHVGQPERQITTTKKRKAFSKQEKIIRKVRLTIPIEEGPRYRIGEVVIEGNTLLTEDELRKVISRATQEKTRGVFFGRAAKLRKGDYYSRAVLRQAVQLITDAYGHKGYIYADPRPRQKINNETLTVDVLFQVDEGVQARLDRIEFKGNTRTRDKVMRREISIPEGGVFDTVALRSSLQRLSYLGFLEEVVPDVRPQEDPTQVELVVSLKDERRTELQVGGGYSSVDKFFGQISLSEYNLFGNGQELQVSAQTGQKSSVYRFRFADRYFLDTRNFFSFDIFRTLTEFPDFEQRTSGGTIFSGRRLANFLDYRIGYTYKLVDILNVAQDASSDVLLSDPSSVSSSITQYLVYDSRNNQFEPTSGSRLRLTAEYAGGLVGGDNQFYKYIADAVHHFSLPRDSSFMVHGQLSYADGYLGGALPVFERFRLGGEQTVRGFSRDSIGPIRSDGDAGTGNKSLLFNTELVVPLAGPLKAVLFFDAGDVYARSEDYDIRSLRTSAGAELRFFVPAFTVPFRFIWGFNLDPWEGEDGNLFQFTLGSSF